MEHHLRPEEEHKLKILLLKAEDVALLTIKQNDLGKKIDDIEDDLENLTEEENDLDKIVGTGAVMTEDELTPEEAETSSRMHFSKSEMLKIELDEVKNQFEEITQQIQLLRNEYIQKLKLPESAFDTEVQHYITTHEKARDREELN